MASQNGPGGGSQERYESLHTLASPSPRRTASGRGGGDAKNAGGAGPSSPYGGGQGPQRPGKLGKIVRMASQLVVHGRVGSENAVSRGKVNYGSMDSVPRVTMNRGDSALDDVEEDVEYEEELGDWRLILLTLGLAGAQLTWTVELGYGTPYLLSLGLSKELTSLVWLAGPLSGFVVQPLIGALSDNSSSKYRRRRWVVYASVCIVLATLVLAFAGELAAWLIDLFNRGAGDWDPKRTSDIALLRIILAVFSFYVLDFSLNGIQAALRALVLDMVPSFQQTSANAYLARMTNIGNIVGYGVGYLNLSSSPVLHWIGGGQFRKLCIVAIVCLVFAVTVTCVFNEEQALPKVKRNKSLKQTFSNIVNALIDLPIPIRRICYVQLFAWSGFFPMMFYSTTWVAVRYKLQYPEHPPTDDDATRQGSLSLLAQSIVAVLASIFLPLFQAVGSSDWMLSKPPGKFWNLVRWSLTWWTPRNLWTASHIWFVTIVATTFAAKTVEQASAVVALLGVSWAITCWVPFGILMEFIRELEAGAELNADEVISASEVTLRLETESQAGSDVGGRGGLNVPRPGSRTGSVSPSGRRRSVGSQRSRRSSVRSNASRSSRRRVKKALTECRPLLDADGNESLSEPPKEVGGTILGIHNLAIVSPQFITAIVAAIIFKISEATQQKAKKNPDGLESGADVVWVLRFGGLMTVFAIILSRYVPAPPSEVDYINGLKEASNVHDSDDEDDLVSEV